jgi:VIT1/CCC1 family predicted Fe2+/Mn2+ transporter
VDLLLWIIAIVLAIAFALVGLFKLLTPYDRVAANPSAGWARDFSPAQVKLIGLVELAGAAGLVLPPLLDVAEWLVPLAAAGLALDMLGAFSTHLRRHDPRRLHIPPIVLGVLAVLLAVGRYWIEPF